MVHVPSAAAQMAPDSPRMTAPWASERLGLHWVRGGALPTDGDALVLTAALPGQAVDMRVRVGGGAAPDGGAFFLGGLDVAGDLSGPAEDAGPGVHPVVRWSAGVGGGVGDHVLLSVPVGISVGVRLGWPSVAVRPWLYAGIVADRPFGASAPEAALAVHTALDLGVDLAPRRGRVAARAVVSLGDRQAASVGLVWNP